jgi:uncharacterized membrane protein YeiB
MMLEISLYHRGVSGGTLVDKKADKCLDFTEFYNLKIGKIDLNLTIILIFNVRIFFKITAFADSVISSGCSTEKSLTSSFFHKQTRLHKCSWLSQLLMSTDSTCTVDGQITLGHLKFNPCKSDY